MDMNLGRVRCFVEVSSRGTVAAAAESLGYTGPAISQQITKFEAELGTKLFNRVGGRLVLNEAGERFRPMAFEILDSVERATNNIRHPQPSTRPIVVMGFPSAIFALVAPATTSIKSRVSAPVKPIEAEDAESLSELSLGNADIAIVQEHSHVEASRQDRFVYHHVRSDPMVIITAESFDHQPTNLSSLSSADWIVSSAGTPCQESTTVACLLAGFEPNEVAKVDELRNTIALVASMNAVSLVPRLALPDKLDGIRVADVDTGITREIYAVTRASADDRATGAVIEALARVG